MDKVGCISFEGRKYEVGLSIIGCTVNVIYDPADITDLTIQYEGHAPWKASQLVIGERAGKRPKLPELQPQPAQSSRLLTAAVKGNQQRREQQAPAVSYRAVRKEGSDNV